MRAPWWLNPVWIGLFWILLAWAALAMEPDTYVSLMRAPKYTDLAFTLSYTLMLGLFILGSVLANCVAATRLTGYSTELPEPGKALILLALFAALALAAYAVWFGPAISVEVLQLALSGAGRRAISAHANHISGVTTATQFAVAVVAFCALYLFHPDAGPKHRRLFKLIVYAFALLALARAFIWSERLALIELIIPVLVLWMSFRHRGQAWIRLGPLLGFVLAYAIFAIFEYFRSWQFYGVQAEGFLGFSIGRFFSYYISSINNFAMLEMANSPSWLPLNTLSFLFLFPGLEGLNALKEMRVDGVYLLELARWANPEFNLFTAGGYLWDDFGWLGGSVLMLLFGAISGGLYQLFRRGTLAGLLFFPVWAVGLLDMGRILYWPSGRAFPAFVLLMLLYIALRARASRGSPWQRRE